MIRIFMAISFLTLPAFAKDIDLQSDKFGSYFGGNIGQSRVNSNAYKGGMGDLTELSDKPAYNTGLEFGLIYNIVPSVTLRGGAEILQPSKIVAGSGTDTNGVEWMTINSSIYAFNPKVALDLNLVARSGQRLFVSGTVGWTEVNLENNYAMTAAGTTQYGKTSFDEKASGTVISWNASLGYELHLFDNSTMVIDTGYRSMALKQLKLTSGTDSIAQGAVASGTVLKNTDGTDRAIDLSGFYAGVSFRFYIHL